VEQAEIKSLLSENLLRDLSYTQRELAAIVSEHGTPNSQSSVSRLLKKWDTQKRLVRIPQERNTARTLDIRQCYAREVQFISNENFVFLDETGVNLNQCMNYGYSPKKVRAHRIFRGNRGKTSAAWSR
jgi:arginine repressor